MEVEIKEEDTNKIKHFGELISKCLKEEHYIDINKLDELYLLVRTTITDKNNEIMEWYDDKYLNNMRNFKNNLDAFSKKMNESKNNICVITFNE